MAGIVSYGSYVPYFRLDRSALGGAGERAVASYDENSVSMAVEAARAALAREVQVDSVNFATTRPGYMEKLDAATLHAALDLPSAVGARDLGGSRRAGLSSLLLGSDLAEAGRRPLVCTSDLIVGAPGGALESAGGDAAAAFVFGPDRESGARVLGHASATDEFVDLWRAPGDPFARQWEERFGVEMLVPPMQQALAGALEAADVEVSSLSALLVDSTNARAVRTFLAASGADGQQTADELASAIGRSGVAHAPLLLAAALDGAAPGDRIAVVVGADGADAMVIEATERIADIRPRRSVADWVTSKSAGLDYNTYLKWRGILPFEPPRRPDPKRPAAPPSHRVERWKYAFVGSRCDACGAANLPPQRVCVACQAVDRMQAEPFAEARCKVKTYTVDRLAYSLQPPVVTAVLDFEVGGRFPCQVTDLDPGKLGVGDEMEMTFRLLHTAEGIHNYFWKARPPR